MITVHNYNDWLSPHKLIKPKAPINLYADQAVIASNNYNRFRKVDIYLQVETNSIGNTREYLLNNWRLFKYIFTHDAVLLSRLPNTVKYQFGGLWIKPEDYSAIDMSSKKFQISSLVGFKDWIVGHKLRHELYFRQKEFSQYPLTIYRSTRGSLLPDISNNQILPNDDKISLFKDFQYSIVIENDNADNYFTEKIIDCLITKTIPIYWGCQNISEFFDTTGWILFNDIDDLKEKLKLLNNTYYDSYIDVINKNCETAKLYTDFHENINRAIRTLADW